MWYIKEISPLLVISGMHRPKFSALSPVMVEVDRKLKISQTAINTPTNNMKYIIISTGLLMPATMVIEYKHQQAHRCHNNTYIKYNFRNPFA
jgi:hypothetical protein